MNLKQPFEKLRQAIPLKVMSLFIGFSLFGALPLEAANQTALSAASLTYEGVLAITLILIVLVSLLKEWLSPDMALFWGGMAFCAVGLISFPDFLRGFANPTLLTLAMLFIVLRTLEINGFLDLIGSRIFSNSSRPTVQLTWMCFPVALFSSCFSNTAIAVFLTPLIRKWALDRGRYPSKYLIPVVYSAILGGSITLIGSSSNLVVNGLLSEVAPNARFDFFTLTPLGLLCSLVGVLFLVFFGPKLLPKRNVEDAPFRPSCSVALTLRVGKGCTWQRQSVGKLKDTQLRNLTLVEIRRQREVLDDPANEVEILEGDKLVLVGDITRVLSFKRIPGLQFVASTHRHYDLSDLHFSEAVLASSSWLIGQTIKEVAFRQRFGASIVSIYREGKRIEESVKEINLKAGDVFFLLSSESILEQEKLGTQFYLMREAHPSQRVSWGKLGVTGGLVTWMVLAAYVWDSLLMASTCTVAIMLMFRLISLEEAKRNIRWDLLVLVGSGWAYGKVLESSGVAAWLAEALEPWAAGNPYAFVAIVFLVTALCAQVITATACVMIVFPVALHMAHLLGFSSISALQALAATVTIGAATCYLTPIGYQGNMIIYGPGGYQFKDFFKVGLPLSLLLWLICTLFIPYYWPLIS